MSDTNREQIRRWVEQDGLKVTDRKAAEPIEWHFEFNPRANQTITVIEGKQPGGRIEVLGGLNVDTKHQKAFAGLPKAEQDALAVMMRRDLMLLGVIHQGVGEFKSMLFRVRVFEEDLSRRAFQDAVLRIQNAIIHLRGLINLRLHGDSGGTDAGGSQEPEIPGPFDDFIKGLRLKDF